jgi:hypothetical protein
MLTALQGVIESGRVRLFGAVPPEGTPVVVVVPDLAEVERRHRDFDEFVRLADQEPPTEEDIASVSDEELVNLVHEVRAERMARRQHVGRD